MRTAKVECREPYLLMQMIITTLMGFEVIDASIALRTELAVERLPRLFCRFGLHITNWVSKSTDK